MSTPGSSRALGGGENKEMMDVDYGFGAPDHDGNSSDDGNHNENESKDDADECMDDDDGLPPESKAVEEAARRTIEEARGLSMSGDFTRIGGYMSRLNAR